MKVEVVVLGSPSLIVLIVCESKPTFEEEEEVHYRAPELCESRGSRPGLPVPNSLYGLCGRKATFEEEKEMVHYRVQELCESRDGRPGLPVPNSPYGLCGRRTVLTSLK